MLNPILMCNHPQLKNKSIHIMKDTEVLSEYRNKFRGAKPRRISNVIPPNSATTLAFMKRLGRL